MSTPEQIAYGRLVEELDKAATRFPVLYRDSDASMLMQRCAVALRVAESQQQEIERLRTEAGCLERALESERSKTPTVYFQAVLDANLARAEAAEQRLVEVERENKELRQAINPYFAVTCADDVSLAKTHRLTADRVDDLEATLTAVREQVEELKCYLFAIRSVVARNIINNLDQLLASTGEGESR